MTRKTLAVTVICLAMVGIFTVPDTAEASVWSKAVKETTELMMRKFTKEMTEEGVGLVQKRLEKLAVKYGDDAIKAAQKTGPNGIRAIEKAGSEGGTVAKMLAQYGDEALTAVKSSKAVTLVARYGDDAGKAIVKYPNIAEPVIDVYGQPSAAAMCQLSRPQSILLSRMAKKDLSRIGRSDEVLAVIRKYGDSGMDFIWKHKAELMTATVLAAFLSDPEPFINGTVALGENVVGTGVKAVAEHTNWTPIFLFILIFAVAAVSWKFRLFQRLRKPEQNGAGS